jgi:hypothetical protein
LIEEVAMAVQIGKRYRCTNCGAIAVCIGPSEQGDWKCCGIRMELAPLEKLPSSD